MNKNAPNKQNEVPIEALANFINDKDKMNAQNAPNAQNAQNAPNASNVPNDYPSVTQEEAAQMDYGVMYNGQSFEGEEDEDVEVMLDNILEELREVKSTVGVSNNQIRLIATLVSAVDNTVDKIRQHLQIPIEGSGGKTPTKEEHAQQNASPSNTEVTGGGVNKKIEDIQKSLETILKDGFEVRLEERFSYLSPQNMKRVFDKIDEKIIFLLEEKKKNDTAIHSILNKVFLKMILISLFITCVANGVLFFVLRTI